LLATIWLLLSGHTDALLLFFGVVSIGLIMTLGRRMRVFADVRVHAPTSEPLIDRILQVGRYCHYAVWLAKEIVLSNVDVARLVWARGRDIEPVVVVLPDDDLDDIQKVIYANSITLTPGTVSLFLLEDGIHVHALTQKAADALEEGEMKRRVQAL
jgi:multicomponent Na+:H+ antiporter subunit E